MNKNSYIAVLTLHRIRHLLGIPLISIAIIINLSIPSDSFAQDFNGRDTFGLLTLDGLEAGYARYNEGKLAYGVMILVSELPESETLLTTKDSRDAGIKSIAGISIKGDDCTKTIVDHEMPNGLFAKKIIQKCVRTISDKDRDFFRNGAKIKIEYYPVADIDHVTSANFLVVTGGL